MKIHYAGQQGGPYGWGVFGANMVKQWRAMGVYSNDAFDADCVFHVATNPDFAPMGGTFQHTRGAINFGMAFFESELGPQAPDWARQYDCLFVGSTWCKERCAERGITNTEVLIQGVDRSIFRPGCSPWEHNEKNFRIFSGGKFEYRKGQDLVIAAFREFAKDHPEAHLVCSWFNPWPQLVTDALAHMEINAQWRGNQEELFAAVLKLSLSESQFTILPQLSHAELACEMANTDCGLFPNRCEGGTNLVLMEYAACGGLVIAPIATGHEDVSELIDAQLMWKEVNGWAECSVPDMVSVLTETMTVKPSKAKPIPTWESAAKQVLSRAEKLLSVRA